MASIKPRISVEYAENATIVTFTDEKILEEKDVQALQESIMSVIESASERNKADFRFLQCPVFVLRRFRALNSNQQKGL